MNKFNFIIVILSALSLFTPVFSGYCIGILILLYTLLNKFFSWEASQDEQRTSFVQNIKPISNAVFFLFAILIVSSLWSFLELGNIDAKQLMKAIGNYCVKFVIVWFVYQCFFWKFSIKRDMFRVFAIALASGSFIHFVYCLFQRKFGFDWVHGFDAVLGPNRFAYGVYRISGFVGHPLTLGYCQALIFVSSVFIFTKIKHLDETKWEKIAWSISAICSALVILISGSRGPQLAMVFGGALLIPPKSLLNYWKILLPLSVIVLITGIKIGLFDRFFELLHSGFGGDERSTHLAVHWQIFQEHIFHGIGPAASKEAISAYYSARGASDNIMIAHNAFLQFAADFGVLGVLAICVWFASLCLVAKRMKIAGKGMWSIIGVTFVGAMLQNNLQDSEFVLALTVWILVLNSIEVASREYSTGRPTNKNYVSG